MRKLLLCFCAGIIMYASGYTVPGNSSSFYQSTRYSASSGIYKYEGLVYSIPDEYDSVVYYLGVKYICDVHDFMYGDFYSYSVWLSQAWTGNAPSGRFVVPSRVNNHDIVGLGGGALSGSEITTLVCNSNIRVIMSEACKDCKRLESIELPSMINEISYGVFKGCIELKKIDIPINVTKIGGEAFYGCSKLATVSLSAKITDVGKDAFSACSAIDSVTFAGTKPTGIDKCGIREECWINISKSNYSAWKDCGHRLLVTETAIDPSSAIKLRKSLANQMDGITTIVSEVDDAMISEVINGAAVPITKRESTILYISNVGAAYSVKFNANGGTGTMSNQAFVYGTAQNLTVNGFSRDGYSFVGWATSANGAKVYSDKESVKDLTTTANGIVNLYAIWECQASIENISARQRYPWNGLVDLKFTITGTSGMKYGAIFTAKDMIGNTNVAMKTIRKSDGTSIVATEPILPGTYNWIWDASADLPKDFKCDRMTITGIADVSVYTVKFNANGGTGTMANQSFTHGTEKALAANAFTRTGYVFQGWATSASGGKVYSEKQIVKDLATTSGAVVDLYAVWADKVQLWVGGPYWAIRNIGANESWESGYYFWWGDTIGYKWKSSKWVASDGSNSNFSFSSSNTPTYNKRIPGLQVGGWITAESVLSPEYDAAQVHWGGDWRMPTYQEFKDLNSKCDWAWGSMNGVNGYVVRGRGDYSSASIFFPCAGYGDGTSLNDTVSHGRYWSSRPDSVEPYHALQLYFHSSDHSADNFSRRYCGQSVRPVQSFIK